MTRAAGSAAALALALAAPLALAACIQGPGGLSGTPGPGATSSLVPPAEGTPGPSAAPTRPPMSQPAIGSPVASPRVSPPNVTVSDAPAAS